MFVIFFIRYCHQTFGFSTAQYPRSEYNIIIINIDNYIKHYYNIIIIIVVVVIILLLGRFYVII